MKVKEDEEQSRHKFKLVEVMEYGQRERYLLVKGKGDVLLDGFAFPLLS